MTAAEHHPARRPSVVWVVVDQMRAQAAGHAGDPNVRTPHLDSLVADGVRFTRAAAASPLCTPARGAMLTGCRPTTTGIDRHYAPMAADQRTVATELRGHGYQTCYVGKWHLDGDRPGLAPTTDDDARHRLVPPGRRGGFDAWWAYENDNRPYDCLVHTDDGAAPASAQVVARADGMVQVRLGGYETDALTDLLIDWIGSRDRDAAFFAVLSVQPPHDPYLIPESSDALPPARVQLRPNVPPIPRLEEAARRDLSGYYAAIERIDANLGRLRRSLRETGRDQDTYVVFVSDHGDMHGSHGQLRKTSPWEEAIRVPLVVGGPSRTAPRRIPQLVTHVDLAPTTLGLCGVPVPPAMEGADLSAVVLDPAAQAPRRDVLVEQPVPTGHHGSVDRPWCALLTDDGWKYVELDGRPWLLFDLTEDPYELADRAHDPAYADVRERCRAQLQRLQTGAGGAAVEA